MENQAKFIEWAKIASHCQGDTYGICKPFIDNKNTFLDPLVRFVATQMQNSISLTSESILLLILNCKIWDADILVRAVLEGTFKFVYLLMGTPEEQRIKAEEYWNIMPEMARLGRHYRATRLLEAFEDKEEMLIWRPLHELTIDESEADALRKKYSKKQRQELTQRWSFSGLSKHFAEHENYKYRNMGILGFDYGMKCHLIHQDGDGVGIIWDRFRRDEERQDSIEIAHAGKTISDICSLAFFRAGELLLACKQDPSVTLEIHNRYQSLFDDISNTGKDWYDIEYGKPSQ